MPTCPSSSPSDDPRRSEPSRRARRSPITFSAEGLERLRAAARAGRPWERSTGPRTPEGKAKSARNGRIRQKGEKSVRELRAEMAHVSDLINEMTKARESLTNGASHHRANHLEHAAIA